MSKAAKTVSTKEDAASLLSLVLDVAHELETRLEHALAEEGLSGAKASTLNFLAEAKDPLSLSELAHENSCVRSNITQLVDRLETDGLVRRVNDPDDRRIRRAALTTDGRKACKDACRVITAQEHAVQSALSREETATLVRLLRRLISER